MHLFYTPDIHTAVYTLMEEESKHCIKVLRLQEGDHIFLVDGKGGFYETRIVDAHQKRCTVEVLELQLNYGKRNYALEMAISPLKFNDRFEWFLEKATEIGVDLIQPIICHRSEKKQVNLDRCNKIIESAMKQSGKAFHPVIREAISFADYLKQHSGAEQKLIAHCETAEKQSINDYCGQSASSFQVLIGPEGDFSPTEIEMAMEHHFKAITLGNDRYRTETAAIMACTAIQQNFV
jgi:16S rRNA (uracil1498-N3)-methyltransferase